MRKFALVVLVALAGCVGASGGSQDSHRQTLEVLNDTGHHVTVYANGMRVGVVRHGRGCLTLPTGGTVGLTTLSYKVPAMRAVDGTTLDMTGYRQWVVDLGRVYRPHDLYMGAQRITPHGTC